MANLQALRVEFGAVFPYGVGMVGEVTQQDDFNASSKENRVRARDRDTGLPMWSVEQDEAAGKRVRSTKRRQNLPDLPKLRMSDRTVGVVVGVIVALAA